MKTPATETSAPPLNAEQDMLRELRHDINNQLSNILLALEQLRYEIPEGSEDSQFYLDSIVMSASKISSLLNGAAPQNEKP